MKIFALSILLLGLSCNSTKKTMTMEEAMTELSGVFTINELGGKNVSDQSMTLSLDPETAAMQGASSCNKLFGKYYAEGDSVSFTGMGSTKMYCEGKMDTEKDYMQALQAVNKFKIKGSTIQLLKDSTVLLTISK
jgi:heat shock protein HslJ